MIRFCLGLLCVIFISGCGDKSELGSVKEMPKMEIIGTDTKGQNLKITKDGERVVFDKINNKVVLLEFFATWCPPCKAEIPHLIKLKEKYKDKFEVVAVLMEENKNNSEIENFILINKINYTVLNSKANFDLATMMGGVKGIPTMFVINTKGEIIQKYSGAVPEELLDADIQKGLK